MKPMVPDGESHPSECKTILIYNQLQLNIKYNLSITNNSSHIRTGKLDTIRDHRGRDRSALGYCPGLLPHTPRLHLLYPQSYVGYRRVVPRLRSPPTCCEHRISTVRVRHDTLLPAALRHLGALRRLLLPGSASHGLPARNRGRGIGLHGVSRANHGSRSLRGWSWRVASRNSQDNGASDGPAPSGICSDARAVDGVRRELQRYIRGGGISLTPRQGDHRGCVCYSLPKDGHPGSKY